MRGKSIVATACCFLAAVAAGCSSGVKGSRATDLQAVPVSQPVRRAVNEHVDYTGRTDAVYSVDVRARATGHLMYRHFQDGALVKKGDLLFEIDPRLYQAQLDQAVSQVRLNEASLKLARRTYERDRASPNATSHQQLDEDQAMIDQADARVKASKSLVKQYETNLEFTKIVSPIDGQISRAYLTEGNLISQDQTLLTTIVSVDPMYVYFDMDEPTLIRIRKGLERMSAGSMPVTMGLQGEKGHPHKGTIDFFNNQVNSTTGSITVRGVFPNPEPLGVGERLLPSLLRKVLGRLGVGLEPLRAGERRILHLLVAGWKVMGIDYEPALPGQRLLSPGMFVRIRLPLGEPSPALLVIDRAIGSDQGLKYVYVIDADNKVQYRRITTGPLQPDGLRVITEGLKPDDWVVVGGLPQIRARMEVKPDRVTMPTLESGQSTRDTLASGQATKKK